MLKITARISSAIPIHVYPEWHEKEKPNTTLRLPRPCFQALPGFRSFFIKPVQKAIELLNLKAGDRVLDVG